MKYLLDTCVISDFVKGQPNVLTRLKYEQPDALAISSVTAMEISYGLKANPARAKKIRPVIDILLEMIHVLPYEQDDANTTAIIRAYLKAQGMPIGPYDVMIGGVALNRNLIMVTSNTKEFQRITGLDLEDWRLKD
jgi:tRNA(fMet)-specific endonuclease VapC